MTSQTEVVTNFTLLLSVYLLFVLSFQYYLTTLTDIKTVQGTQDIEEVQGRQLNIKDCLTHQAKKLSPAPSTQKLHNDITNKNNFSVKGTSNNHTGISKYRQERFDTFSPNCKALYFNGNFDIKKTSFPYKIYVYDLPVQLNVEIAKCTMQRHPCFDISYCGMGELLHTNYDLQVHSTWQFALETIIHNKVMLSIHRTLDPMEADLFYVPYYGAMACFCYDRYDQALTEETDNNVNLLKNFLDNSTYFQSGKPHLMTISKIEREQASQRCPLLLRLQAPNIKYIGIEQESDPGIRSYLKQTEEMIVAPYPSYGHLHVVNPGKYEHILFSEQRNIFVFLAASSRRSNTFRARILDQVKEAKTRVGYENYLQLEKLNNTSPVEAVWLVTTECQGNHKYYTLEYMKHSTFCLQPPGDSPTRKSFYDGLISGCIPVLFKERYPVKWAFQKYIPYENFTVTLSTNLVRSGHNIIQELHKIPKAQIKTMQDSMAKYIKYFQYSHPPSNLPHDDAMEMILREAAHEFHLI